MPTKRAWTDAEDALVLRLEGEGATVAVIAAAIGVGVSSARTRTRTLGITRFDHRRIPPIPRNQASGAEPEREPGQHREPLPAGHPVTWGTITARTCLAGAAYPL